MTIEWTLVTILGVGVAVGLLNVTLAYFQRANEYLKTLHALREQEIHMAYIRKANQCSNCSSACWRCGEAGK